MNQIVSAPAKINLTLDVLGKRADGYHDIESVMHQLDLCDQVSLTPLPEGIEVYSNKVELPSGKDNLAYRAAALVMEHCRLKTGIRVFIEKNIPLSAGLAGGSTDAAAVIKGMDLLLGLGLSLRDMLDLGQLLGSDVPFCLAGGTAIARGRGEVLTPVNSRIRFNMVLVNPGFPVATAQVFNLIDQETITSRPDSPKLARAMETEDFKSAVSALGNVMETVTFKMHPELRMIKEELVRAGAEGALMSGSGPTIAGVFSEAGKARRAFRRMKGLYPYTFCCSSYTIFS